LQLTVHDAWVKGGPWFIPAHCNRDLTPTTL
jgi:hypothetical protein